ncbi:MAG: TROVE domain-containing protein, partial [Muriicola sp.]|nr:TROVE domain-containing protein [Muriicola sp.]
PKMIPNAMRRAFADMLESNKWDAYQLNKYKREGQSVKLRDVILMSHPKDTRGMLGKVIEGTLQAPATMESMLSAGKTASATFGELLRENRLGYMAAVKNIRNALESGISDEDLDLWVALVTNRNRVLKSRMLPFRFVDAWDAVRNMNVDHFKLNKVKEAFNQAIVHSADNLGFVKGNEKVALILDESGSMHGEPWKNAITLAAVLYRALGKERAVVYAFASNVRQLDFGDMSPLDIITTSECNGGATYFHAPMGKLVQSGTNVDSIIMLSDMQLYRGSRTYYGYGRTNSYEQSFDHYFNEYKSKINPRVKMLFWDLRGYGSGTPLELRNDILMASGYSDKLLAIIPKLWKNQDALVAEIEAIQI